MIIKRLNLANWRSHRSSEFEFGRFNLLRGPNNSGKSSVAMAIEYALTGRCAGTDEKGSGADRFITSPGTAREARIVAQIALNKGLQVTLERHRNGTGSNVTLTDGGFVAAGKQVEEYFDGKGWPRDVLSAALRAGRFISLTPGEQKELLADVLRPEAAEVPDVIFEAVKRCGRMLPTANLTLETVREIQADYEELRAECTAALRALGQPAQAINPRPADAPDGEQCRRRLDSLRLELVNLQTEKARRQDKWATASRQKREAKAMLPDVEKLILTTAAEKECLDALEHETEVTSAQNTLSKVRFQKAELEQSKRLAGNTPGKCPTCGHQADSEEIVGRYDSQIAALQSRIPQLESIANKYLETATARQRLQTHRTAILDRDRLKLITDAPDLAPPHQDEDEIKRIGDLEERIQKGQVIVGEIAAHEQRVELYEAAHAKYDDLEGKRAAADQVAKWAGPHGIQGQMTGGKLPAFVEALNSTLGRFGYDCRIELEPYSFRVRKRLDGNPSFDLGSLSESEKWRFSVGFQTAIAKLTGIGVAVFDGADILRGANRQLLGQEITQGELEQVFILASVDEKLPVAKGFVTYELTLDKEGITKLERNGE